MLSVQRKAGVLLPIFSLPSPYWIGTLGKEAYEFADFLKNAGQSYWQILPIGPTGYGDSPYQNFSAFAGNPYFVDLEFLRQRGLLSKPELMSADFGSNPTRVDYGLLYKNRGRILMKAYERFVPDAEYLSFENEAAAWLPGYASFMSRKEGRPEGFYHFVQYEFFRQWFRLKKYVNDLGISIIGDIPIYVAMDSADVEADKRLFQFSKDGTPLAVAGCPPDGFSACGQLWGNPLYDWDYHEKTGYAWWIRRMRNCFRLYDVVRVDHFRGFDEYYSIPFGASDAKVGEWKKGPGMKLFNALKKALGDRRIIAEDLGFPTPSVDKLVKDSGYPGMQVFEFSFDSRDDGKKTPEMWPEHCIAYTGTHDNQTLKSWLPEMTGNDMKKLCAYFGKTKKQILRSDYVGEIIKRTLASPAEAVIIPMHDYLNMGDEARINQPSTLGKNWTIRFTKDLFSAKVYRGIREAVQESKRGR